MGLFLTGCLQEEEAINKISARIAFLSCCLQEEETVGELLRRLLVQVLPHQVGKLVGVLAGGGDSHRSRPVVVEVGQLVGKSVGKKK